MWTLTNGPISQNHSESYKKADHQLTVSSLKDRHPSECLKDLLDIPVALENVTFKKPSLNDVFIQLTGRELRE
jgi:hypothetical protein